MFLLVVFFFQAEDGIRDLVRSRGLGDVYKRQARYCNLERWIIHCLFSGYCLSWASSPSLGRATGRGGICTGALEAIARLANRSLRPRAC